LFCEYSPAGNVIGQFGGNVGKSGQGAGGEPGVGDSSAGDEDEGKDGESESDRRSVGTQLLVALVVMSTLSALYL
jgi:hypothetical protein